MKSRDRGEKMVKKPKKDAKAKVVTRGEAPPVVVEVVKRKRKERDTDDES